MRRNVLHINSFTAACFIITACLFTMLGSRISRAEEPLVLRIVENDWPPYFFQHKPDKLSGFARELLNICIPALGYQAEFTFYPVKRMYSYLEEGKLDIALFSYKESRESMLYFGHEPLFVSGYRPVVRAGSKIRIRDLTDFDNLRIGHLAGLKYSESFLSYIDKRSKAGTLITTTTGDSCLRMLNEGIIDIFVDTEDTVRWRAQQIGLSDRIEILDYDIRTSPYFVTFSKASNRIADKTTFLEQMDQCLKAIKTDGRYKKIACKYGL